jgi:hypothetical protein
MYQRSYENYQYQCCGSKSGAFLPQGSGIRDEFFQDPRSRIPNMTEIKFQIVKFVNFKVYSLEKYRKRRQIILYFGWTFTTVPNHLIRQEKVGFILHLSFYVGSRIRDDKEGRIRDKHPGSATLTSTCTAISAGYLPRSITRLTLDFILFSSQASEVSYCLNRITF